MNGPLARLPGTGARHGPASVRASLFALVLACLLPAAAAALLALVSAYHAMQATLIERAGADSRVLAEAVDGVIAASLASLQSLAGTPALAAGDLAGFENEARRLQPFQVGNNLVLTDTQGRQLVNTALPRGAPLPIHGNPALQHAVLASGQPIVSDLFIGGALRRPLVAIEVPVRRDGQIPYTLAMGFLPDRFAAILTARHLEPDWIVSIIDSQGVIVARTHDARRFVGHPAAPALRAAMAREADGVLETRTLEGTPVLAVYTRSKLARWTVAVGIPKATLLGRLYRWTAWVLGITVALLLLGAATAQWLALRIAGAIHALLEPARALGQGEPVLARRLPLEEAQLVSDALAQASDLLRARTLERDHATQACAALQAQTEVLEHAARHDALTGLPNRAGFMEALQACLARHEGDGRFTVLYIDIDDFKPVNDRHGHAVGDQLLRAFAARLRGSFRDGDIVARLEKDEFAVLVDGQAPDELATSGVQLIQNLSRPYRVGPRTLRVTACAGAASYPADGRDAASLLMAADNAMYRMKLTGKSGFSKVGDF